MRIKAVSFAVPVERYEKAKEYFRKLTGVEPEEEVLKFPKIRVARFEVGGATLEVMTPSGEGSHIAGFLKRHGGGVVSITLEGVKAERFDVPLEGGGFLAPEFLAGTVLKVEG